ncbi:MULTISPECIES: dihydrofolate reductase [unclassified Sinorhizobium]|uniref:dihydrofolate reductase n=1 Tax=unclassified Sinorhizobium TaxID=2613772 RepID=UPI00352349A7
MASITKTIVVAMSHNGIIGRDGGLPWRLSSDLKRFKALTLGKPVVMGRKTFESIGKALPGRPNIVITRDASFVPEGVRVTHSLSGAVDIASGLAKETGADEICIIGGGEIFRQAMDFADQLHVTHIEADIDGDTTFPYIDPMIWLPTEELQVAAGEKDNYATRFVTYRRVNA